MGFFSWLLCIILVVALVLLLFPFSVRIEFEAGERGARALFFFFKKKVYEYEKKWGEDIDDNHVRRESRPTESGMTEPNGWDLSEAKVHKCVDRESRSTESQKTVDVVAKAPEPPNEKKTAPKTEPVKSKDLETRDEIGNDVILEEGECRPIDNSKGECRSSSFFEGKSIHSAQETNGSSQREDDCMDMIESKGCGKNSSTKSDVVEVAKDSAESVLDEKTQSDESKSDDKKSDDSEKSKSEKPEKKKKEKRKLSDREFWTILLTPDLDARAFRYVLKILGAVFSLFRVRFKDCYVEGIQTDYQTMGYLAATNGVLKAFPYVSDWDLRMDWAREKELHAAGTVRLSITLLRIFCFVLETLVLAGILGISFWRRRARVIKTNELPELGFVRRKILGFILED